MLSNDSDELALPDNHESYCVTLGVCVCVLLHAVTWRAPVQCPVISQQRRHSPPSLLPLPPAPASTPELETKVKQRLNEG